VDINKVKGTGSEGRVTRDDIRAFKSGGSQSKQQPSISSGSNGMSNW